MVESNMFRLGKMLFYSGFSFVTAVTLFVYSFVTSEKYH